MSDITALDIAQVEATRQGFVEIVDACDAQMAAARALIQTLQEQKITAIVGIEECDAMLRHERLRRFH